MPSQFLVEFVSPSAGQILWADKSGDYGGSAGAATHQLTLASLASNSTRQGDKADLGANPALEYALECALEWGSAPTAGYIIEIRLAFSENATAGSLNPGGLSGTDAASTSVLPNRLQMSDLYHFRCLNSGSGTVQRSIVGLVRPYARYVMPYVGNFSTTAFHTDDVEMYVRLIPRIVEAQ